MRKDTLCLKVRKGSDTGLTLPRPTVRIDEGINGYFFGKGLLRTVCGKELLRTVCGKNLQVRLFVILKGTTNTITKLSRLNGLPRAFSY